MKKEKVISKCLLIFTMICFCLLCASAYAYTLLDGKLDLRGNVQQTANIRTDQDERGVTLSSFRSVVRGEAVYKMVEIPCFSNTLHVLSNWYFDEALALEPSQREAIRYEAGSRKFKDFRRPQNYNESLTEFYFDIKYQNFFQLKLGKQLVSWGETAEARVADVINPLNTKYLVAFPDWEDYKLGLWMARFFITPKDIWQDLSFELLLIPQYLAQQLPPAGSGLYFGSPVMPNQLMQKMLDKQRRDEPDEFSFEGMEVGLRLRGNAHIGEGVDWYLSHFYTRADSPVIDGMKGYLNVVRLMLGLPMKGRAFKYPRYNSTAFTFATTSSRLGGTIRGECVYNTNKDYQYGTYQVKERELLTAAFDFNKSVMVPKLSAWNRNTAYSMTLAWYQYYMPNQKYNKATKEYIHGETGYHSTLTKFTLGVSTGFLFYTLIPQFNFVYDTHGGTTVVTALVYKPGDHWQWIAMYQKLNKQGIARFQNQVTLSMRYEFW